MITRETLSEIMSLTPDNYLTTTLYLHIHGGPQHSDNIELKEMIKLRKQEMERQDLSPEVLKSARSDLRKINDFVTLKLSREGIRTLIIFSCSARKIWQVLSLSLPLRSQMVIHPRPYLRPLMFLLEEYGRFLVILVERSRARLFEVYAGEIVEHTGVLDEVPGKVRMGGFMGYEERRIARHIEDHVRRHFRNVANAAFDLHKMHSFDSVVLLGSEQNTGEFHHYLHNALHDRIVSTEVEELNAGARQILDRTSRIEVGLKRQQERRVLERLFDQVNSGGLAIVGLDSTIRALQQGQVNFLVVQEGYERNGFRCEECRSLSTNNGSCDYCGGSNQKVGDVVDEAVQEAIHQGCQVKYISSADSQLYAAGRIGAMLRFRT